MRIIIDLDGTICTEEKTFSRPLAKVNKDAVKVLKKLKRDKHTIIIYTARTWNEYEMTHQWLTKHNIPFDQLYMGKPIGDYWIDDRAIKYTNWNNVIKKIK